MHKKPCHCLERAAEEGRNRLAQTEIQPPSSFRRRPESSGLYKPFPQCGNDIRGGHWVGLARVDRNGAPLAPRPAFLDSSLRWNDDGVGMRKTAEEQKAWQYTKKPVIPACLLQAGAGPPAWM